MLDVKKLRNDIQKKLNAWNERSSFTLKGVKNLSRSDMSTLLMFCDQYDATGSVSGCLLRGSLKNVLYKYGLEG